MNIYGQQLADLHGPIISTVLTSDGECSTELFRADPGVYGGGEGEGEGEEFTLAAPVWVTWDTSAQGRGDAAMEAFDTLTAATAEHEDRAAQLRADGAE